MTYNRKIIYSAGFLYSLPIALASYINSSFISSFTGEKLVGIIYALASIVSIIALLITSNIFRKMGGYRFLLLIAFMDALSFLAFVFVKSSLNAIIIFIFAISLNTLLIFSLDEILKIFSKDSTTGRTRGIYIVMCNLAWIIAELAFGTILGGFSFRVIYFVSFLLMMSFLLMSFLKLKNIDDPQYDKIKTLKYVGEFFKNKNLSRAFNITFLLQFFYCWMVIYTPIYLYAHLGFTWREIGIIFTIMLLPFALIPFHLGKYTDKIGERKILMFSFAIASFATLSLFFIHQHSVWLWSVLLFTTRVGAASVEVASDTYFFKHIKPENEELVGVYRSTSPVAYILGPLFAFIIFIFIPSFNFIFPILGTIMLYGVYLSSTIDRDDI